MSVTCEECGATVPSDKCPSCREDAPLWAKYCPHCGFKLAREVTAAKAKRKRQLCSDESCIGIIGPDGLCTDCGKRP
ncbi:MAG: zinc ribbon domain-containing protein [Deltaproteobacteria bacterium]|jgi:predicted amidophosphoribosyltransferase|nr:zinc ribbon domain-containing protein [Deltaproteobacteria bacterium]